MMNKTVLFGKESRDKILAGIQKITNAVKVTMGAAGKNVLIGEATYHEGWFIPLPTRVSKDGWTVAKHFELADPIENRGAMQVKEAATKTVEEAGDSTTCTCVLAEALVSRGMNAIDNGANSQLLKKGMEKGLAEIVDKLKQLSTPVRGDAERIRQIATVSSNNDEEIGNLIAEAFKNIGDEGVIDIEQNPSGITEIKYTDGYKLERGWVSPHFINNRAKETCEFDNPLILLYQNKINHHTQIERAVKIAVQAQRPLLIIAEDCVDEGLAFLAINNLQKQIVVCCVKSPFGTAKEDEMNDLALITGGTYISDIRGIDIRKVDAEQLGKAKKVVVSKTGTVIIGGERHEGDFNSFVASLRNNVVEASTEQDKSVIEKRIARLMSSVAVIKVGAATETELNEKIDRVDDAVRATKAAIAEGYVAGGGTAFLRIEPPIPDTTMNEGIRLGRELVYDALKAPFLQICENAGINGQEILLQVLSEGGNVGYNVLTDSLVDMEKAGIIDSTKALRCALVNAVSVAGMVLTSECSIITIS